MNLKVIFSMIMFFITDCDKTIIHYNDIENTVLFDMERDFRGNLLQHHSQSKPHNLYQNIQNYLFLIQ